MLYTLDCWFSQSLKGDVPIVFQRTLWSLFIPLIYLSGVFIVYFLTIILKYAKFKLSYIQSALVFLFLYLQPNMISILFSAMSCRQIDQKMYIQSDVSFECYTKTHIKFIFLMCFPGIMIWAFMIPIYILKKLIKNKNKLDSSSIRMRFGFLYQDYKNEQYYWEFVRSFLKVIIVCIYNFYGDPFVNKIVFAFIMIILYKILLRKCEPFQMEYFQELDKKSTYVILTLTIMNIFLYSNPPYSEQVFFYIILVGVHNVYLCYLIWEVIKAKIQISFRKQYLFVKSKLIEWFPILANYIHVEKDQSFKSLLLWKMIRKHIMIVKEQKIAGKNKQQIFRVSTLSHIRNSKSNQNQSDQTNEYLLNNSNQVVLNKQDNSSSSILPGRLGQNSIINNDISINPVLKNLYTSSNINFIDQISFFQGLDHVKQEKYIENDNQKDMSTNCVILVNKYQSARNDNIILRSLKKIITAQSEEMNILNTLSQIKKNESIDSNIRLSLLQQNTESKSPPSQPIEEQILNQRIYSSLISSPQRLKQRISTSSDTVSNKILNEQLPNYDKIKNLRKLLSVEKSNNFNSKQDIFSTASTNISQRPSSKVCTYQEECITSNKESKTNNNPSNLEILANDTNSRNYLDSSNRTQPKKTELLFTNILSSKQESQRTDIDNLGTYRQLSLNHLKLNIQQQNEQLLEDQNENLYKNQQQLKASLPNIQSHEDFNSIINKNDEIISSDIESSNLSDQENSISKSKKQTGTFLSYDHHQEIKIENLQNKTQQKENQTFTQENTSNTKYQQEEMINQTPIPTSNNENIQPRKSSQNKSNNFIQFIPHEMSEYLINNEQDLSPAFNSNVRISLLQKDSILFPEQNIINTNQFIQQQTSDKNNTPDTSQINQQINPLNDNQIKIKRFEEDCNILTESAVELEKQQDLKSSTLSISFQQSDLFHSSHSQRNIEIKGKDQTKQNLNPIKQAHQNYLSTYFANNEIQKINETQDTSHSLKITQMNSNSIFSIKSNQTTHKEKHAEYIEDDSSQNENQTEINSQDAKTQ